MRLPLYQIDAFAEGPFTGNPAAVCPLESWLPDDVMQAIAAENNLSETAFFVSEGEGYRLRWFTPTTEVDLCGHATLAAGFVVFGWLTPGRRSVTFQTQQAGTLTVARDGDLLALDFPSRPAVPCAMSEPLAAALGRRPAALLAARDYLAVYDSAADIAALMPAIEGGAAVVANARRLLKAAEMFGVPVLFTEQNAGGLGPTLTELAAAADGRIAPKMTFDACRTAGFLDRLADRPDLVVAGCE